MKLRTIMCGALTVAASVSSYAAPVFTHGWGNDQLSVFETDTATETFIGNTGVTNVGGMSFNSAGDLFAVSTTGNLYNFNTTTAASTLIGSTGVNWLEGLTFGLNGTLYASGGSTLYSIDENTGAATSLGSIGQNDVDGFTVATTAVNTSAGLFAAGTLFGTDSNSVFALDVNTLTVTSIGSFSANESIAFDTDGNLYGHNFYGALYELDLLNGTSTLVGNTSGPITGLASAIAPTQVSEPGSLALLGLGLAGLGFVRRKQS